jgi:hypothetical protein
MTHVYEAPHGVAPASRWLMGRHSDVPCRFLPVILCLTLTLPLLAQPLAAKTRTASGLSPGYVAALAAADHFLQAWQSGDIENGMILLSSHAKAAATSEGIETFFSNPGPSGYEITRGKLVKHGRYEFPVVLVTFDLRNTHTRRRFSSIVVVNTGNNEWAVDKLP